MTFYMLEMTELWKDGRWATSADKVQLYYSSGAIIFGRCAEREKGGRSLPLGIKTRGGIAAFRRPTIDYRSIWALATGVLQVVERLYCMTGSYVLNGRGAPFTAR